MVFSKIDPEIKYKETASISPEDIDLESSQYDIIVRHIHPKNPVTVVFGNVKYNYSSKNILFYPIYLVVDGETKTQIGIIEIPMEQLPSIIDDDGDIDPDKIPNPILYGFVNTEYILKHDPEFTTTHPKRHDYDISDSDSENVNFRTNSKEKETDNTQKRRRRQAT